MIKRYAVDLSLQASFQKKCLSFLRRLEKHAHFFRENPDDRSIETTGIAYRNMMVTWAQVEHIREAGLNMVDDAPKSPLIVERRSYWFLQAMADQREFEDACDLLEAQLEDLAKKVLCREAENLWVAGILENIATTFEDDFHLSTMDRK
ncbi:hypothetical protein MYU51_000317 [Penicillium brevicompactum]|uniref:uncharacterized protein n=1 Tax=Penicillium brevicompactum TaxID=5074 RepID=UPI00254026D1|nr:uncharacterized protein N7506_008662 [Penicillium brevicompactum]KAJ5325560.1 hypothetical protein N7506_008662 [Penicillium brevicompactum]